MPADQTSGPVDPSSMQDAPQSRHRSEEGFARFLEDVTPFFYRRALVYVDVGAFSGSLFGILQKSKLTVREAHLIEPNPESFALLKANAQPNTPSQTVSLYNLAISNTSDVVRMHASRTMTRVVADSETPTFAAAEADSDSFEAKTSTLDEMSAIFLNQHVSILKVDVEGHEPKVLEGATKLFENQRVDILYIEAGADKNSVQQCHYRIIDDIMERYGYRLFRIYEQTHQWTEDLPTLRRMNLAYMSPRFAANNPYRLSRELLETREKHESLSNKVAAQRGEIGQLKRQLEVAEKEVEKAQRATAAEVSRLAEAAKDTAAKLTQEKATIESALLEREEALRRLRADALEAATAAELLLHKQRAEYDELLTRARAELDKMRARATEERNEADEMIARLRAERKDERAHFDACNAERDNALATVRAECDELRSAVRSQRAEADVTISRLRAEIEKTRDQAEALRAEKDELIARLCAETEELRKRTGAEVDNLRRKIDEAATNASANAARKELELDRLRNDLSALTLAIEGERKRHEAALSAAHRHLAAMEASTSWRITAPIRVLKQTFTGDHRHTPPSTPRAEALAAAQLPSGAASVETERGNPPAASKPALHAEPPVARATTPATGLSPKALEQRLWGGFSRRALAELEAIARGDAPALAAEAAYVLAGWRAAGGDLDTALVDLEPTLQTSKVKVAHLLLKTYCLTLLGRKAEARLVVEGALARFPNNISVQLALANTVTDDETRLAYINLVLEASHLAPLRKADPARPLNVDNLAAPATTLADVSTARVSVILPVFNGAGTIGFALKGLLAQTWSNLDIIVSDDCSTDDTVAIARGFSARDARVRILTHDKNQGSYTRRNNALAVASGDFITVHDANDWSHPQKIERQVRHLLENTTLAGNFSNWARVIDELIFVGKFRRKDTIVDWNPSSFMFRRALLDKVGGWDSVRISADAELIRRAREVLAGSQEIRAIPEAAPLAFAHDDAGSLTKHSATHGRTIFHGLRREYKEASGHWHSTAARKELRLAPGARAFPAPGPILPDRVHAECDVLLIANFNGPGLGGALALADADAAVASGQRVAVFNWRAFEDDPTALLPPSVRQRAQDGKLRVIAPGEPVTAETIIVTDPGVLLDMVDLPPMVSSFKTLQVLVERADASLDKVRARAHLREAFGEEGDWG